MRQSGVTALTVNNNKLRAPAPAEDAPPLLRLLALHSSNGGEQKACPNPLLLHPDVYGK